MRSILTLRLAEDGDVAAKEWSDAAEAAAAAAAAAAAVAAAAVAAAAAAAAADDDDDEDFGLRLRVWMPSFRMASGRLTPCNLW